MSDSNGDSSKSLVSIKDLLGLSEPMVKLVDIIARGTGVLYKPTAIRKEAKAHADGMRYLAQAEADKILIVSKAEANSRKMLAVADAQIEERIKARLASQEMQRQQTLEHISEQAEKYLPGTVSEEPVDDDWIKRFFNIAQDISNEQMQEVWAKILAGEVAKPQSYSLRTLDTLKNITQNEAEVFQIACSLAFSTGHILKIHESLDDFLSFGKLLILRSAGLLHESDMLNVNIKNDQDNKVFSITNNGIIILFEHPSKVTHSFDCLTITTAGKELRQLIPNNPNNSYLDRLKAHLEKQGYKIQLIQNK